MTLHPEAQKLADYLRTVFGAAAGVSMTPLLEYAIADFAETHTHVTKPTVFLVVCDCLSYYPTENEMEDHCSIIDLGDDTSYLGLAYLNEKVAKDKVQKFNEERRRYGSVNERWDYYVLEVTPEDA